LITVENSVKFGDLSWLQASLPHFKGLQKEHIAMIDVIYAAHQMIVKGKIVELFKN
jgi:hypothetical protein